MVRRECEQRQGHGSEGRGEHAADRRQGQREARLGYGERGRDLLKLGSFYFPLHVGLHGLPFAPATPHVHGQLSNCAAGCSPSLRHHAKKLAFMLSPEPALLERTPSTHKLERMPRQYLSCVASQCSRQLSTKAPLPARWAVVGLPTSLDSFSCFSKRVRPSTACMNEPR